MSDGPNYIFRFRRKLCVRRDAVIALEFDNGLQEQRVALLRNLSTEGC